MRVDGIYDTRLFIIINIYHGKLKNTNSAWYLFLHETDLSQHVFWFSSQNFTKHESYY